MEKSNIFICTSKGPYIVSSFIEGFIISFTYIFILFIFNLLIGIVCLNIGPLQASVPLLLHCLHYRLVDIILILSFVSEFFFFLLHKLTISMYITRLVILAFSGHRIRVDWGTIQNFIG